MFVEKRERGRKMKELGIIALCALSVENATAQNTNSAAADTGA